MGENGNVTVANYQTGANVKVLSHLYGISQAEAAVHAPDTGLLTSLTLHLLL